MSSTSLNHPFNLSLLSRGVGEVKLNGHEKVEVVLEPEDYMNYAAGESTILPPLQPQYAHVPLQPMYSMGSSPRNSLQARESCQELHVPKTFTTRKGALLLFSEDYALKNRFHETDSEQEEKTSQNKDLRTVEDLTNSILKYGSRRHGTPEINLHFLHDRNIRRVRPGFSARRYLSRLTRSFDDNFLDSMLTKGFIYEKSIFENNAYLPSSTKRRIDDDLSYMPAPYRIMKQMLMAPGMLSGFSFYRSLTLDSEFTGALTILQEEESTDPSSAGLEVVEVKDGIRHSINYEGLSKEEQENVLADLLVKSAINHAMEKQEKNMLSGPKNEEDGIGSPSTIEFNMGEAVQSYLESQVDKKTLNDNVTTKPGFKGRSLSNHNARSFEAPQPKSWPKTAGPKEFFNGIPVVSVRDTESGLSSAKSQVTQSYHSVDLNPNPVLPPISPSPAFENEENPVTPVNLPKLQLQPPTPQMPTMASEDAGLSAKSREPTFGAVQEEEDEPFVKSQSEAVDADVHSTSDHVSSEFSSPRASKHIFGSTENLGSELSSHRSPHGLKGRALHGSSPRVVSSKLSAKMKGSEGDSLKGSVIYAPDGEIISVGGSIASRSPVPSKLADDQLTESAFSGVDEELDNLWDQKSTSSSLPAKSIHTSRASSKSAHKALTEDQMVKVLSEHARSIAASVLSRPGTGMNVIADAQTAAKLWLKSGAKSRNSGVEDEIIEQFASSPNAPIEEEQSPTIEEYKEILRETLTSVVSKVSGNPNIEIPKDAEVTEELIEALAQDKLSPEDIEVVSVGGRSIIRRKSVASTVSRMSEAKSQDSGGCEVVSPTKTVLSHHTLENQEEEEEEEEAEALLGDALSVHLHKVHSPPVGDMVSFGVVDYGRQGGGETKELIVVRPAEEKQKSPSIPPSLVKKTSVASSPTKSSRKFSVSSSEGGKSLKKRTSITSELSNKDGSPTKSNSLEDRNEFVVGKVPEPKAIEAIYAPIEEPPKPKEKKPRVPKVKSPAKKPVKAKGKGKKKAVEKPTVVEKVSSPVPPPAEVEVAPAVEEVVSEPPARSPSLPYLPKTPEEKEEEDIEFVIVRDEFSDTEEEEMADHVSVAPEEVSKAMSIRSSVGRPEEEEELLTDDLSSTDEKDEAANLKAISNKEARAAKRAAQAAKRREEVERKRKEREEALKREREEAERKDNLQRELEEERRRREEEKRMLRERMEEQERRQELEEAERERRAAAEAERQKRQKEEYQRKLEEMRRKQHQEEAMRKILEEQKRKEEELLRIEEAKKMEAMEEAERLAYEEKKREEQELKRQKQEEQRLRAEEEARMALEAAERLAQEMARQQAELERRLQFNRSLQLESTGLEHTQDITRAFVFSYYEFLQWLGLEVPDFDQIKQSMGY